MFNPHELDQNLSDGFDGQEVEIYEDYNGDSDSIESFSGNGLKALEKSTKRFTAEINNQTTSSQEVALTPGMFRTAHAAPVVDVAGVMSYKTIGGETTPAPAGKVVDDIVVTYNDPTDIINAGHRIDAVGDDGVVYKDATGAITITAKHKDSNIRQFIDWIKSNPTIFAGLHILSNDTSAFESVLQIRRTSPFAVYGEERIPFQDGFIPENRNTDKIIIKRPFQLDNESLAILSIPAKTKLTISFIAGAASSQAIDLKRKTKKANIGRISRKVTIAKKPTSRLKR